MLAKNLYFDGSVDQLVLKARQGERLQTDPWVKKVDQFGSVGVISSKICNEILRKL